MASGPSGVTPLASGLDPNSSSAEPLLSVGIVRAPHGVHGYFNVSSLSGEVEHLLTLKTVVIGAGEPHVIEDARTKARGVIMKIVGIETPEAARDYNGAELRVPRKLLPTPQGDEYYVTDLIGCAVQHRGQVIGTVSAVFDSGASDIVEVVTPDSRPVMLPFVKAFFEEVDVAARVVLLCQDVELAE